MILSVVTIILSIVSFSYHWLFIGAAIAMVLAVAEYIAEVIFGGSMFGNPVMLISSVVLGIIALVMCIISIIVGVNAVSGPQGGGSLLLAALEMI